MSQTIIAIDPGVNGAWAVLSLDGRFINCDELPRFAKTLNVPAFAEIFREHKPSVAVLERVSSMRGQGVSSTFTFGTAYGICLGVIGAFGVPINLVTPSRWKSAYRLTGLDKDASRELAIRLYPAAAPRLNLKKYHGRADAILMARFYLDNEAGKRFT